MIKRLSILVHVFNFLRVKSNLRNCQLSISNKRKGQTSFPFLVLKLSCKKSIHFSLVNKSSFSPVHGAKLLTLRFRNRFHFWNRIVGLYPSGSMNSWRDNHSSLIDLLPGLMLEIFSSRFLNFSSSHFWLTAENGIKVSWFIVIWVWFTQIYRKK